MTNSQVVKCAGCGESIMSGEGQAWAYGDRPWWSVSSGRYLCEACAPVWMTWRYLRMMAGEEWARVQYWVTHSLPGAPEFGAYPDGTPGYLDQRAVLQSRLLVLLDQAGLACYAFARRLARTLELMDPLPDEWGQVMRVAELVWNDVIDNWKLVCLNVTR